jgi:hypothetical protein
MLGFKVRNGAGSDGGARKAPTAISKAQGAGRGVFYSHAVLGMKKRAAYRSERRG